jgi:hypothetical protein
MWVLPQRMDGKNPLKRCNSAEFEDSTREKVHKILHILHFHTFNCRKCRPQDCFVYHKCHWQEWLKVKRFVAALP